MKPSPVDRTFDLLSNGMHNLFLTKMSLRTLMRRFSSLSAGGVHVPESFCVFFLFFFWGGGGNFFKNAEK